MNEKQEIRYCVFAMYNRGSVNFLWIDATNLTEALVEALEYLAPNILLIDQFGNQYTARVDRKDQHIPLKGRCVTTDNRSCHGCSFKSLWTGNCTH